MRLDNGIIAIEIANHGAELKSATKNGFEYMWCGNAEYWGRTSPVLFPIVGSLKNKSYKLNGKVYEMSQHGFARDNEFKLLNSTKTSAIYEFCANEETLKNYAVHPSHVEVADTKVRPFTKTRSCLDFEI